MPAIEAGELPALRRLMDGGVFGSLRASEPLATASTWTTLVTGVVAHRHQVLTDLEPDGRGDVQPVGSRSRRSPAIWNILAGNGLRCHVVGFPASHPAESVLGTSVSDRFIQDGAASRLWPPDPSCVCPSDLYNDLLSLRAPAEAIDDSVLGEFLTAQSRTSERQRFISILRASHCTNCFGAPYRDSVGGKSRLGLSRRPLRHDWFDMRHIRRQLSSVETLWGICEHPARRDETQDMMIARLMELCGPASTVWVASNHGFQANATMAATDYAAQLPRRMKSRANEIVIGGGPGFRTLTTAIECQAIDVLPTLLAQLGVSAPPNVDGKVISEVLDSSRLDSSGIFECESKAEPPDAPEEAFADPWVLQQLLTNLCEVGCLEVDLARQAAIEHAVRRLLHLAMSLAESGELENALTVLRELEEREPSIYPAVNIAECLLRLRRLPEADETISRIGASRAVLYSRS